MEQCDESDACNSMSSPAQITTTCTKLYKYIQILVGSTRVKVNESS